jgi:hypothetical protein
MRKRTLIIFFLLLVFIKIFITMKAYPYGPRVFGDELLYRVQAHDIFNLEAYSIAHYPPLYPLLLSPSFFSQDNWHEWMLFINIIISSALIIPLWMISRLFLSVSLSFIVVAMSSLWQFHVFYPSLIMSENLHVPLSLLSIYLFLEAGETGETGKNLMANAFFGVSMALAYLTRFIYLVAIPVLLILWWLKPRLGKDSREERIFSKFRILSFGSILAGFSLTYMPWMIYAHYSGFEIIKATGFKYAIKAVPKIFSAQGSLTLWITVYVSYTILVLAPYLLPLSIYSFMLVSRRIKENRSMAFFLLTVFILSGAFLLTAIQHSWRMGYNYPTPLYLIGRYLMHLTPLYFIVSVIALDRLRTPEYRWNVKNVVVCLGFSLAVLILSRGVLYDQLVWELPPWFADILFNSPDSKIYKSQVFTWFVALTMIIMAGVYILLRWNIVWIKDHSLSVTVMLLIIIQLMAFMSIYRWVTDFRDGQLPLHGKILSTFLRNQMNIGHDNVTVIYDIPYVEANHLTSSLQFWLKLHFKDRPFTIIPRKDFDFSRDHKSGQGIYLLTKGFFRSSLFRYTADGAEYAITDLGTIMRDNSKPVILDYGPRSSSGEGFNIQPDGRSAMWLKVENISHDSVVIFHDMESELSFAQNGLITTIVPSEFYGTPGTYEIYLYDRLRKRRSDPVTFEVKER